MIGSQDPVAAKRQRWSQPQPDDRRDSSENRTNSIKGKLSPTPPGKIGKATGSGSHFGSSSFPKPGTDATNKFAPLQIRPPCGPPSTLFGRSDDHKDRQ